MNKRNGVVLLMTLVLVTIMSGIIAIILAQSGRISKLGESGFQQSAALRLVDHLEARLPSMLVNINNAEDLDLSMRLPLSMESAKGDFTLNGSLSSPYSKLNINRLINSDGTPNDPFIAVWMRIFNHYPIADPEKLLMLILDSIDTDSLERGTDTEIRWSIADFKNGLIKDKETFSQIIERYILLSGDRTVLTIPWEEYIGFEGEKMDVNALNPQTLMLLVPEIAVEKANALTLYRTKAFVTKEEVLSAEPALGSVYDNFLFLYSSGLSYNLHCDVRMSQKEHIRFEYNLLDKKIRHVEFI